jgi:hypothetical protein
LFICESIYFLNNGVLHIGYEYINLKVFNNFSSIICVDDEATSIDEWLANSSVARRSALSTKLIKGLEASLRIRLANKATRKSASPTRLARLSSIN